MNQRKLFELLLEQYNGKSIVYDNSGETYTFTVDILPKGDEVKVDKVFEDIYLTHKPVEETYTFTLVNDVILVRKVTEYNENDSMKLFDRYLVDNLKDNVEIMKELEEKMIDKITPSKHYG